MAVVPSPIHPRHSSPFRKAQDTSRLSTTTTAHGPSSGASSEHYPDIFQAFLLSIPAPSHPCPPMAAVSDPVPPGHPSPFRKAQKFSGPSATTTAHGLSLGSGRSDPYSIMDTSPQPSSVLVSSPFYPSGRHPSPGTAFYYPIPAADPFDCLCTVSSLGFCSLPYLHPHLHYNSTLGTAVLLFLSMLPSYPQPRCSATHHSLNPRVKDSRFYHGIIILTAGPGVTGTSIHLFFTVACVIVVCVMCLPTCSDVSTRANFLNVLTPSPTCAVLS